MRGITLALNLIVSEGLSRALRSRVPVSGRHCFFFFSFSIPLVIQALPARQLPLICRPAARQSDKILIKINNIATITLSFFLTLCFCTPIMGAIPPQTVIKGALFISHSAGEGDLVGGAWQLAPCLRAHQRNIKCLWLISSGPRSSIIPSGPIRAALS